MSTTTRQETYTCERSPCRQSFTKAEAFGRGAYCSAECFYRDKGTGILEKLDSDHSECSTCFRPVFYPRPIRRDNSTTHLPPSAVDAVEALSHDKHRPTYRFRAGCDCGTTNPTDSHGFIRDVDDRNRRKAFAGCLFRLAHKGAIDAEPTVGIGERIREAYDAGVRNWAHLAGRAIYAGESDG